MPREPGVFSRSKFTDKPRTLVQNNASVARKPGKALPAEWRRRLGMPLRKDVP